MKKYIEIDFLEYASEGTYVSVNPFFRKDVISKAVSVVGTKRKLAYVINVNKGTLNNWKNNARYNKRKLPLYKLIKICRIAGISIEELRANIKYATIRYPSGDICIEKWKIFFDENFAEWLALINGDGSISDRDLSFSNTYIPLTFYFAKFLEETFDISRNRISMTVTYYTDDSIDEALRLLDHVKLNGYENSKIYRAYNHKGKKINLKARVGFKVLTQLLMNINKNLNEMLMGSFDTVKAAYLKGYAASEGCISISNSSSRVITITQNDKEELEFIKSLLQDIGIEKIDGPRWSDTAFRIATSNRKDIKKFQEMIGFGAHTLKNNKLEKILNSYKYKG